MKAISLTELKSQFAKYASLCRKESVVVTVKGVPMFQMGPLEDELIDNLIAHNPKFRALLQERVNGKFVSSEESAKWFD